MPVDGKARGLPKSLPATSALPDGWVLTSVSLVGSDTKSGGSWSYTVPVDAQEGDIAVIASATRNSSLGAPTAGTGASWTQIYHQDIGSSEWVGAWVKVLNGSEPSTYSQTLSGTGAGGLAVYRRDTPLPSDATIATTTSVDVGSDFTPTRSVTTTELGGVHIPIHTSCYNGGGNSPVAGDLVEGFFIQQSVDELATVHAEPITHIPVTGTLGLVYNALGDGGYRATATVFVY